MVVDVTSRFTRLIDILGSRCERVTPALYCQERFCNHRLTLSCSDCLNIPRGAKKVRFNCGSSRYSDVKTSNPTVTVDSGLSATQSVPHGENCEFLWDWSSREYLHARENASERMNE
jgi:hypothetical protein